MSNYNDARGEVFTHEKTKGIYKILGFAIIEATNTHSVIYQCLRTGITWVRPTSEFFDGRFVYLGRQE